MPLADGTKIAGYVILRQLGAGGMGEVYLAQHPRLPRQDALKVLRADVSADADFLERFEREADLAAKLWHPHVVGIHDRGKHRGRLWISMDYVEGTDASRMLHEEYPDGIALQTVMEIVTAVASALDHAHARNLLHRDVKPANILVAEFKEGARRILLTDFGVARDLGDTGGVTVTNMTVGTVAYAAPEQLMGMPVDGRADQYALAATAYHLLNGAPLFPHSNPAVVIGQHLNAAPPSLAERHPPLAGLDAVLRKALAKNPKDRFTSCSEFARALADSSHTPSDVSTQWAVATPATRWPTSGTPVVPAPLSAAGQPPSVSPKRSGQSLSPLSPGWYPDPSGKPGTLYWDGQGWLTAPLPIATPSEAGPGPKLGGSRLAPLLWVLGIGVVIAIIGLMLLLWRQGSPPFPPPTSTITAGPTVSPAPSPTPTDSLFPPTAASTFTPTTTTIPPPPASSPPSSDTDLNVSVPMSHPACDGMGIVVLGNAVTPPRGRYAAEVQQYLNENPGASYLRTDEACPSLRPSLNNNPIYAVYRPAGRTLAQVCAAVRAARAAGSDVAYGKWLSLSLPPDHTITC